VPATAVIRPSRPISGFLRAVVVTEQIGKGQMSVEEKLGAVAAMAAQSTFWRQVPGSVYAGKQAW
jgi:hypothetical protein